eukprot:GHVU01160731.1.p1 GENE.GHVU01160731.1~~GHVU01160731.1.p1  ORF type:complete len:137 (-),score=6.04 GHVU01160731.1:575-985(-)
MTRPTSYADSRTLCVSGLSWTPLTRVVAALGRDAKVPLMPMHRVAEYNLSRQEKEWADGWILGRIFEGRADLELRSVIATTVACTAPPGNTRLVTCLRKVSTRSNRRSDSRQHSFPIKCEDYTTLAHTCVQAHTHV